MLLTEDQIDDLLQRNGNLLAFDGDKIGYIGKTCADDDGQLTVSARKP